MTEKILENMEQRKEQKDKDIARYKLLDRDIRQECKQAKEDHYIICVERLMSLISTTTELCTQKSNQWSIKLK